MTTTIMTYEPSTQCTKLLELARLNALDNTVAAAILLLDHRDRAKLVRLHEKYVDGGKLNAITGFIGGVASALRPGVSVYGDGDGDLRIRIHLRPEPAATTV